MFCTRGHAFHLLVVLSHIKIKYKFSVSFLKKQTGFRDSLLWMFYWKSYRFILSLSFSMFPKQKQCHIKSKLDRSIFFINLLAKKATERLSGDSSSEHGMTADP